MSAFKVNKCIYEIDDMGYSERIILLMRLRMGLF